jgi:hypothetical protein
VYHSGFTESTKGVTHNCYRCPDASQSPYGPNGTLLWTDDLNGANAQAWLTLAADVLGIDP